MATSVWAAMVILTTIEARRGSEIVRIIRGCAPSQHGFALYCTVSVLLAYSRLGRS